jgi:hypothetical protein
MNSKFEEKTYESYFNAELDRRSRIFFPLGQVQEGFMGFDSSAFSRTRSLWRRLGYPFWFYPDFDGVPLNEIEHFMGVILTEMPSFKVNLLFQYKRSEYIKLSSGREWSNWNRPYFRYNVYKEQQQLLMLIHNQFGNQILTLYAAPAVYDVHELVRRKIANQIIESSNFQHCHKLDGHHRNTYVEAGIHSVACSDPEELEKIDLLALLNGFNDFSKDEDNRQFIINFRTRIVNITYEDSYYGNSFRALIDLLPKYDQYPLTYSFLIMNAFKQLTGIQWLINM